MASPRRASCWSVRQRDSETVSSTRLARPRVYLRRGVATTTAEVFPAGAVAAGSDESQRLTVAISALVRARSDGLLSRGGSAGASPSSLLAGRHPTPAAVDRGNARA
jgi:hypothetical protein